MSSQVLLSQLLLGLINGSFYAILSLGLAVIFGLLNIINFAHGALYMIGAFCALLAMRWFGVGYWGALIVAPVIVGLLGVLIERLLLKRLYQLDHLYGLLLTFGLALIAEGFFRWGFGVSGESYPVPESLRGGMDIGIMFLPIYRAWVVVASLTVWNPSKLRRLALSQRRIVGVAFRAPAVQGGSVQLRQRRALPQALDQIRVADEGPAESHQVALSAGEGVLGHRAVVSVVDHPRSPAAGGAVGVLESGIVERLGVGR